MPTTPVRFPISFSGVGRAMGVIGLSARNSWVDVGADDFHVRMGWGFRLHVPLTSVRSVGPDDRPVRAWGVHGWRGRWLVNGSSHGVVRIDLDPPGLGSVLGAAVRVSDLRVSVDDPDGLIRALRV